MILKLLVVVTLCVLCSVAGGTALKYFGVPLDIIVVQMAIAVSGGLVAGLVFVAVMFKRR